MLYVNKIYNAYKWCILNCFEADTCSGATLVAGVAEDPDEGDNMICFFCLSSCCLLDVL